MQLISDSVGTGGANAVADIALVQAILLKTTRAAVAAAAVGARGPRVAPPARPQPGAVPQPVRPPAAVTAADVTLMRQALRAEFDLADTNWRNWTS